MLLPNGFLADLPLTVFLEDLVVPYEDDEVTRLIVDSHDRLAFAPVAHLTVGGLRDWLLETASAPEASARLSAVSPGLTPEMVAAVSKIMRNQDLIAVAKAITVTAGFRTTIGLPGRLSTRLQPNHPTDDPRGIAAATLDGLLMGCGDAVIGINPATDSPQATSDLLHLLDDIRQRFEIPTQSCVLSHVTTTIGLIESGVPVDLVFQSIAGTEGANSGFGVNIPLLREGNEAGRSLNRGTVGNNVMYLETGQGSALSSGAHYGTGGAPVDQQTLETRAYAVARDLEPLLVNTVVGFIGPEYLYDGKQIIRAGLEDHFCGKLLGLPMGVDVCYTNHAEADQDDMDNLLTLLGVAGAAFVIAVPGADDVMLGYQSLAFHDALYVRKVLGLQARPGIRDLAPQFGDDRRKRSGSSDRCRNVAAAGFDGELMTEDQAPILDFWGPLRKTTQSRIGLGRAGDSLPTKRVLEFKAAHAAARDAVHEPLDSETLAIRVEGVGIGAPVVVASSVSTRSEYLRRPDLGRQPADLGAISRSDKEIGFILADGLSPRALMDHGEQLLSALVTVLGERYSIAPPVIATNARVALGDHIAAAMGVQTAIVLIGERPGLSVADSVGIYLTHLPRVGRTDADRNCISNVHPPEGLGYEQAARVVLGLVTGARQLGRSGVDLKDTSRADAVASGEVLTLD